MHKYNIYNSNLNSKKNEFSTFRKFNNYSVPVKFSKTMYKNKIDINCGNVKYSYYISLLKLNNLNFKRNLNRNFKLNNFKKNNKFIYYFIKNKFNNEILYILNKFFNIKNDIILKNLNCLKFFYKSNNNLLIGNNLKIINFKSLFIYNYSNNLNFFVHNLNNKYKLNIFIKKNNLNYFFLYNRINFILNNVLKIEKKIKLKFFSKINVNNKVFFEKNIDIKSDKNIKNLKLKHKIKYKFKYKKNLLKKKYKFLKLKYKKKFKNKIYNRKRFLKLNKKHRLYNDIKKNNKNNDENSDKNNDNDGKDNNSEKLLNLYDEISVYNDVNDVKKNDKNSNKNIDKKINLYNDEIFYIIKKIVFLEKKIFKDKKKYISFEYSMFKRKYKFKYKFKKKKFKLKKYNNIKKKRKELIYDVKYKERFRFGKMKNKGLIKNIKFLRFLKRYGWFNLNLKRYKYKLFKLKSKFKLNFYSNLMHYFDKNLQNGYKDDLNIIFNKNEYKNKKKKFNNNYKIENNSNIIFGKNNEIAKLKITDRMYFDYFLKNSKRVKIYTFLKNTNMISATSKLANQFKNVKILKYLSQKHNKISNKLNYVKSFLFGLKLLFEFRNLFEDDYIEILLVLKKFGDTYQIGQRYNYYTFREYGELEKLDKLNGFDSFKELNNEDQLKMLEDLNYLNFLEDLFEVFTINIASLFTINSIVSNFYDYYFKFNSYASGLNIFFKYNFVNEVKEKLCNFEFENIDKKKINYFKLFNLCKYDKYDRYVYNNKYNFEKFQNNIYLKFTLKNFFKNYKIRKLNVDNNLLNFFLNKNKMNLINNEINNLKLNTFLNLSKDGSDTFTYVKNLLFLKDIDNNYLFDLKIYYSYNDYCKDNFNKNNFNQDYFNCKKYGTHFFLNKKLNNLHKLNLINTNKKFNFNINNIKIKFKNIKKKYLIKKYRITKFKKDKIRRLNHDENKRHKYIKIRVNFFQKFLDMVRRKRFFKRRRYKMKAKKRVIFFMKKKIRKLLIIFLKKRLKRLRSLRYKKSRRYKNLKIRPGKKDLHFCIKYVKSLEFLNEFRNIKKKLLAEKANTKLKNRFRKGLFKNININLKDLEIFNFVEEYYSSYFEIKNIRNGYSIPFFAGYFNYRENIRDLNMLKIETILNNKIKSMNMNFNVNNFNLSNFNNKIYNILSNIYYYLININFLNLYNKILDHKFNTNRLITSNLNIDYFNFKNKHNYYIYLNNLLKLKNYLNNNFLNKNNYFYFLNKFIFYLNLDFSIVSYISFICVFNKNIKMFNRKYGIKFFILKNMNNKFEIKLNELFFNKKFKYNFSVINNIYNNFFIINNTLNLYKNALHGIENKIISNLKYKFLFNFFTKNKLNKFDLNNVISLNLLRTRNNNLNTIKDNLLFNEYLICFKNIKYNVFKNKNSYFFIINKIVNFYKFEKVILVLNNVLYLYNYIIKYFYINKSINYNLFLLKNKFKSELVKNNNYFSLNNKLNKNNYYFFNKFNKKLKFIYFKKYIKNKKNRNFFNNNNNLFINNITLIFDNKIYNQKIIVPNFINVNKIWYNKYIYSLYNNISDKRNISYKFISF